MKLYIKQKVFSWRDKFFIKDEAGNDRFYAEGEFFTWGRKLHVYNMAGQEVAFIRRKMWTFLPKYYIETGGQTYMLVKEFTFFKQRFYLDGTPWAVQGDFWAHEYSINDGVSDVMRMSKHWFTWGDSYELDIPDPKDEILCLCVTLGIDCIQADAQDASHSH